MDHSRILIININSILPAGDRLVNCLVSVEERKASDEVVTRVHATDNHLGVVSQELEGCNHGKAAVVELLGGELLELLSGLLLSSTVTELEGSPVVNSTDQEDHLQPAKGRNGLDGSNTVRDGGEGDARGDVSRELEDLRDDVADDSKLGNTAVLKLSSSVLLEVLLSGKVKRIPVAKRFDNSSLTIEHLEGRAGSRAASRGEGRGADEGSNKGKSTEHFRD